MSSPYVGEIRMFAGNFAPAGWAMCWGQLMPISQNDTLFNLIGTTYGGDGQETFGIPNVGGHIALHMGQGPGITQNYTIGESFGVEQVTLTTAMIPSHTHPFLTNTAQATLTDPTGALIAEPRTINMFFGDVASSAMNATSISAAGGSQPHENIMPTLAVTFIISLFGIYPTPS